MNWRLLALSLSLFTTQAMAQLATFAENLAKAEQGDTMAQTIVGTAYHFGRNHRAEKVEQDYQKALYWYRQAAARNQPIAYYQLGQMYRFGRGVAKDMQQAFAYYLQSAELGERSAMGIVAHAYYAGDGVSKDDQKAFYWFKKSAENGLDYKMLAVFYFRGIGTPKDYQKAFQNFNKAIQLSPNDAALQEQLGIMYEKGLGTEKDLHQAFNFYYKAAEKGKAYAQSRLAYWFNFGNSVVSQDQERAFTWAILAAKQGDFKTQTLLGSIYIDRKDYQSAFYWFSQAEKNDPNAQLYLGMMYEYGLYVLEDVEKAKQYYQSACNTNVAAACEDYTRLSKQ